MYQVPTSQPPARRKARHGPDILNAIGQEIPNWVQMQPNFNLAPGPKLSAAFQSLRGNQGTSGTGIAQGNYGGGGVAGTYNGAGGYEGVYQGEGGYVGAPGVPGVPGAYNGVQGVYPGQARQPQMQPTDYMRRMYMADMLRRKQAQMSIPAQQAQGGTGILPSGPPRVGLAGGGIMPYPVTPMRFKTPDQVMPENRQGLTTMQDAVGVYGRMGTPVSQMQTADQLVAQGAPSYDPNQRALIARAQRLGGSDPQGPVPMDAQALAARISQMQQGEYAPGNYVGNLGTQAQQGKNGIRLQGRRGLLNDTLEAQGVQTADMTEQEKRQALNTVRNQRKQGMTQDQLFASALKQARLQDKRNGIVGGPDSAVAQLSIIGKDGYAEMLKRRAEQLGVTPGANVPGAKSQRPTSITAAQKILSSYLGALDQDGNYTNADPVLAAVGVNRKDMKRWEYGAGVKKWLDVGSDSEEEFGKLRDTIVAQSMIPDNKDFQQNPSLSLEDALAYVIQTGQIDTKDKAHKFVKDYEAHMGTSAGFDQVWGFGTSSALPPGYFMVQ